jgi:hypothetical protein
MFTYRRLIAKPINGIAGIEEEVALKPRRERTEDLEI